MTAASSGAGMPRRTDRDNDTTLHKYIGLAPRKPAASRTSPPRIINGRFAAPCVLFTVHLVMYLTRAE